MMARQRLRFRLRRLSRVIPSSFSFNCRSKRSTSTSTTSTHPPPPPTSSSSPSSSGAEADASSDNTDSSPRTKIDSHLLPPRHPRRLSSSSGDDSGWFSSDDDFSAGKSDHNCFAVSKISADPRGDFRQSMAEMVAEREIYNVEGLRWLLHCFLSLNHRRHREAVLAAFADVWYAVFPSSVALAATFPNMFYK